MKTETVLDTLSYNEFLSLVQDGKIANSLFEGRTISGKFTEPYRISFGGKPIEYTAYKLQIPFDDPSLVEKLKDAGVKITAREPQEGWFDIFIKFLPWLLIPLLYFFMLKQLRGGQSGIFNFGKSKAERFNPETNHISFADVAGCVEAKEELMEVVDYLKNPFRFANLGGKAPKGALLLGAPGTGKTLLAKAVAGEAGVPFFSMSGSDFVEMFVGVGAARVRDLFDVGKKTAPCIIFIDEIDAVGRHRGAGLGGGHDEREQTLNQLLVEMDGFEPNEGIVVLAATNRPDVLDPALLRPGRFDRRIIIDRPDIKGREDIFRIHAKHIECADNIDFTSLAAQTPGLVGADIANIVNEAALLAARDGKKFVEQDDFEQAKDKVILGVERKSAVISPDEKKIAAYHESGHALVAKLTKNSDPVHKISIIPRGLSLGVTYIAPDEDKRIMSRSYLTAKLVSMLGGRAAEILIFGEPSTGAQNDIEQATELAHNMVCRWGMSDELGPLNYAGGEQDIFLGKEIIKRTHISDKVEQLIDQETKKLVEGAFKQASELLSSNIEKLHKLALALLDREVLDGAALDEILGLTT